MLTIFLTAFAVVIIVTAVIIATRRCKRMPGELYRIREISMTAVLGALLWLEAGTILYYDLAIPQRLITNSNSQINVYIFLTLSILTGAGMLLYYFVKSIVVCEDSVTYVSFYGTTKILKWEEITEVRTNVGKRFVLIGKNNVKMTVGGQRKTYKEFIELACKKIRPEVGEDILIGLKKSLKM